MINHPNRQALPPSEQLLLSIRETCRLLGIGRTMLYQLIADRRVRPVKIGRRTLFKRCELQVYIDSLNHD